MEPVAAKLIRASIAAIIIHVMMVMLIVPFLLISMSLTMQSFQLANIVIGVTISLPAFLMSLPADKALGPGPSATPPPATESDPPDQPMPESVHQARQRLAQGMLKRSVARARQRLEAGRDDDASGEFGMGGDWWRGH